MNGNHGRRQSCSFSAEALRQNAYRKDYLPVRGLHELREAIATHHRREFGIQCDADDVLIGPGSKELMFLLQLVYDGELVVPSPSWVSYAPQARIIGRRVSMPPTSLNSDWHLTAEQLDDCCRRQGYRPRLLILNYPANPTGRTLSEQQLEAIANVARKHQVVVLADEIYGKLHHNAAHRSIVPFYPEGTIFSGGLSKWCGAGGWRLGLFVFPKALRWLSDAMAAVASETFTSTSAPIQYAAVRAFQGGDEIENYLVHCRRVLRALGAMLTKQLLSAGANVLPPQGGFYLFPDFTPLRDKLRARGILTSEQMCARLLDETGVAILPGSDFGRTPDELTARIAYVDFDGASALKASERADTEQGVNEAFVRAQCGRAVEAVARVCEWIHQ